MRFGGVRGRPSPERFLWHYPPMETHAKLFRAIVILGAALVTPGCEEGKCPTNNCLPSDAGGPVVLVDGTISTDGGPSPVDADTSDVILIL